MKKKLLLMLTLCLLAQWSVAQAPKWVDKAKRAVFSVVTYDQNDKILNTGNGFFVTEDGVALSDYTLFKGAQRAVVMSSDGAQMPVEAIMGADDMYDVVKFRVGIPGKKVTAPHFGCCGSGCRCGCISAALFHPEGPFLHCRESKGS